MSKGPHAVTYADRTWQGTVAVKGNTRIGRDTYRLRFDFPQIARRIVPGQFVMVRLAGCSDPLLGRALALYDVVPAADVKPVGLEVVYLIVGKLTRRLSTTQPGALLDVWGPLGNGFPPTQTEHLVMVAGGIGQTPFPALAREYLGLHAYGDPPRQVPRARQITLCYGARSAEYLAGIDDFERAGVEVRLSTDDGTAEHHGVVTDLIAPVVEQSPLRCRLVCCGPEPMLAAAAKIARELGLPCQVSLETPMACGIGICFSCVAKIRDSSGQWDYRRTCVEGPVFEAEDVEF
jgi:dihydroorotate dehydrogenase electron transfer subunit